MGWGVCVLTALALQVIAAARVTCPSDPNCVCGGSLAVELNCEIGGRKVEINYLPNTYINIKCVNVTTLDYNKLPKCANNDNTFKSVTFKDCPLPENSFKEVLNTIGVSKTMALIFQNEKLVGGFFDKKHFTGLEDLKKLLLSVNGITNLPNNLFEDINKLTWLNIRSKSIHLSEELFKPLERLETLEISHNHMTNISENLFAHLSFLRKLSLWQSNVTKFSKDFFTGVDVLEELDLSSNGLDKLPPSIFKPLKKLKKLTLFANKFSSLPQNLFKSNDELETVIVLNNDVELRGLPRNLFGGLPNLKQVYLQRCGLETIPYDVFANSPQITSISLAYNDIIDLPEAIFNDQINLLELDLSHNYLTSLEPKLFSSLVRLEKLDLSYNNLVKISGSSFSSLLSLLDLNMEHNKLEIITGYLFSNNRQRMSVSLAYNKLNFEYKELRNNTWVVEWISPFSHTYNLKLLNLSYNEFTHTCEDWWMNGHDILDFRHNFIKYLWDTEDTVEKFKYRNNYKKPLKEVWLSYNNYKCSCLNNEFSHFLHEDMKTEIKDLDYVDCEFTVGSTCKMVSIMLYVGGALILALLFSISGLIMYISQDKFYEIMKKAGFKLSHSYSDNVNTDTSGISIEYSDNDEEFVFKEVLPCMRRQFNMEIDLQPLSTQTNTAHNTNTHTLVIFSPNYLTSRYSHVNIKKIRGEMLKARNRIYMFADIGPENSIYAFLKEQRNRETSIVWTGQDFSTTFLHIVNDQIYYEKHADRLCKFAKSAKKKAVTKKSLRNSPYRECLALNDLPDMQV